VAHRWATPLSNLNGFSNARTSKIPNMIFSIS
jgi:hypothetical protein